MSLAKTSLPLMLAVSLGMVACNDPPGPTTSSALQAANSKTTGSTSDPAATSTCKESTDASGVPCKICVDSSGSISYDDCGSGGTGGVGGTSGSGAGGSGVTDVKCAPTTDPTTGAAGTGASCVGAPNIETGQICKVCSDAVSGKLLFVDCGPPACPSPASTPTSPPPAK